MKFEELGMTNTSYINGKIAQYIDVFIRNNKVWTPQQLLEEFNLKIEKEIDKSDYKTHIENSKIVWTSETCVRWLITKEGKEFSLKRINTKYKKNKPVAVKKSPIVDRVRFGQSWKTDKYFDINFGLQDKFRFIGTKELEKITFLPWSIEHVNQELKTNYNLELKDALNKLSTSHLEKIFYKKWINEYYTDKNNPALIPEVCGFRPKFYYFENKGNFYTTRKEIPASEIEMRVKIKSVNFRYDFLIINFRKQKIAFIELDGFEFHKTREQQTIDSIKRNTASRFSIPILTFTSKRILEDLDAVFEELKEILT